MSVALKVPFVGESITEVEIGEWLKPEGSTVATDEAVVAIETEKTSLEISAPVSGRVVQVLKKTGERASIGEVIGYIEESAVSASPQHGQQAPAADAPQEVKASAEVKAKPEREPDKGVEPVREKQPARPERIVPMTPIRRRIAERLVAAQQNAALLTTFNEVDMAAVADLRARHKEAFQQKHRAHQAKMGIVSFFVLAVIRALREIPQLNAEIRGDNIVYRDFYDIGIAIGSDRGLVVPVLRNADRLSLSEVEIALADLAQRARENRLKVEDLQGGTFTLSNGGVYGSLLSTPIVNPPQSGVLGLHAITDRPVVRDGQIVARPMMYVALTYDHRIIDGREAVTFLKLIKQTIEEPALLLLNL